MTTQVTANKSANVLVTDLNPVSGASVTVTLQSAGINNALPALDPADAFAIGDAMKDAARKAGFTPNATTQPAPAV